MANVIGVPTLLASAGFYEELQKLLDQGHGTAAIDINEARIIFKYTVSRINVTDAELTRERQRLALVKNGEIKIHPSGNVLIYEFTHSKKIER